MIYSYETLEKESVHQRNAGVSPVITDIDLLDLTIAIPVKNEQVNLPKCLEAIGSDLAKHVIVLDSGSTDRTKEIAEHYGAKLIDFNWNGKFPKKRNWFLRNHPISTKWVLFIDADEYLSPEFKLELRSTLPDSDKCGYWLNYTVYFLGKELKGGYPLKKLALFQVNKGEYEQIDEDRWSTLDMEVHEHPIILGDVGSMKCKIDHRDFNGTSKFVIKHNEYASWEAARFLKAVQKPNASDNWTLKQKLKYRLMKSIFIIPLFFFGTYILYRGFRDGARGFAHAMLRTSYYTQIYCKIKESQL